MPTHVALLRGINLGPHKRVAMPALRTLVESLGHTDVATYIASGNVVFTASGSTTTTLAGDLEKAIADELGVTCRVVVLTSAELAKAVADNPYPDEPDPKRVHAFFLTAQACAPRRADHVAQAAGARRGEGVAGRGRDRRAVALPAHPGRLRPQRAGRRAEQGRASATRPRARRATGRP